MSFTAAEIETSRIDEIADRCAMTRRPWQLRPPRGVGFWTEFQVTTQKLHEYSNQEIQETIAMMKPSTGAGVDAMG